MKILTYGSLNLDYVYRVDHICSPGETISSKSMQVNCGGKGLNQSIALSRAGAEVYHAGAIGHDGGILRQALEESGVKTDYLFTLENIPSGQAIIQVDDGGQNCIILFGGANQAVPEMDEVLSHFGPGDYLALQNEVNGNAAIMRKAHEKGMKIVLNPSPMDEKILQLPLEYVDWFILNEVEMDAICGGDAQKLMAAYPNASIMLTLGDRGAVCYHAGKEYPFGIYKANVVDTTAAGDTFTGYFIASLAAGKGIEKAVATATKASSISVSRPGAYPSIPYPRELEVYDAEYIPYRS